MTASATATILARCNEVLDYHHNDRPEADVGCRCTECLGAWPCDAYISARDLRDAVEALKEIKGEQGLVCPEFELCEHASCASSYASWAIADNALAGLADELKGDDDDR